MGELLAHVDDFFADFEASEELEVTVAEIMCQRDNETDQYFANQN